MNSEVIPTEKIASEIVRKHFGQSPASVTRFTTGNHHYVYECTLPDGSSVVARLTRASQRHHMAGALHWNLKFAELDVPVAKILYHDISSETPYLVMERLPGRDIGYVLKQLSVEQMDVIAKELMRVQKLVGSMFVASRFGYAIEPAAAPFDSWSEVLRASLKRSRSRIESSALMDITFVDATEKLLDEMKSELDRQAAVPFLHDITTKNVIIADGRISGIVDIDNLCFGDPLFQIALTKMALLSDQTPPDYIKALLKHYGTYAPKHLVLYTMICCVDFMSEMGQTFNGLAPRFSPERKRFLELIWHDLRGEL